MATWGGTTAIPAPRKTEFGALLLCGNINGSKERNLGGPIGETRRSTRVPLRVVIAARSIGEPLMCDGETIIVNRHGALIACTVPLHLGMKLEITVIITDKCANATVVYIDPQRPFVCGIALDKPENIWGLALPPDDRYDS